MYEVDAFVAVKILRYRRFLIAIENRYENVEAGESGHRGQKQPVNRENPYRIGVNRRIMGVFLP